MSGRTARGILVSVLGLCSPLSAQSPHEADFAFEPVAYDLDVSVDYENEMIRADATIVVRNQTAVPATVVPLLLNRLLTVRDASGPEGTALGIKQAVVAFDDEPRLQVNAIRLRLPRPVDPGDTTSVRIEYDGFLTGYEETGSLYIRDAVREDYTVIRRDAYAYPVVGVPSDSANRSAGFPSFTYRARIEVPEDLVVANGGELVERVSNDERISWVYRSRSPSWRMDFAIAPYGRFDDGDFRVFYLPGDSIGAQHLMRAAKKAFQIYSRWFGRLEQHPGLTIIEIPDGFGSQKDVTTILQVASAFRDSAQLRQVYHEVAHSWTPAQAGASPRTEEGLATFLEYLTADSLHGTNKLRAEEERAMANLREWFTNRPEFASVPMAEYGERRWTSLSYTVGFVMYGLLYEAIGAESFNRFVGEYYRCCHSGGASTRRLAEEIERRGGHVGARILEDWLWTTDWWPLVRDGWSMEHLVERYASDSGD